MFTVSIFAMRKSSVTALFLSIAAALMLSAAPVFSAAPTTVTVLYHEVKDIKVDFPNGKTIEKGGELVIEVSSSVYNVQTMGIWFYEHDPESGKTDWTTSVTLDHTSELTVNGITHHFYNLDRNVEMSFTEPEGGGGGNPDPEVPETPDGTTGGIEPMTIVMLASIALAAVLLVLTMMTIRKYDEIKKKSGA
jgi:hypothetical protein